MQLKVKRIFRGPKYTIGNLYIDNEYFCDTLEDVDRGLDQSMSVKEIIDHKIYAQTAIPTGTYPVTLDVKSPAFSRYSFYREVCQGKLPRLLNVKGFEGILIHVGDGPRAQDLTAGCILIGKNTIKGQLTDGKQVFKNLINRIKNNELEIIIE